MQKNQVDLVVVGAGASGLVASLVAAKSGKSVILVEQLDVIGKKLKATGGGRCNLSNTLDNETFMNHFGKNGRFMGKALEQFNSKKLIEFFESLGVKTHCPDGFRIFPITHNSNTILDAFNKALKIYDIKLYLNTKVDSLIIQDNKILGISTQNEKIYAKNTLLSTGGLGYSTLGATGEMFDILSNIGHKITQLSPAMMPLFTKEKWVGLCTADTIPKVIIKIDIKKYSKIKITGDLIFTKQGLRGPAILDIAKYITPILDKIGEVPIVINLTKFKNEDEVIKYFNKISKENQNYNLLNILETILPNSISLELLKLCNIDTTLRYSALKGEQKNTLIKILVWTPFTIIGHEGFKKAMITTGGVSLKQIDPNALQSKIIKNLYFAGEMIDLDGPCGGYNLQWAFSSGYLVGNNIS